MDSTGRTAITLEGFASRVGCHFSTASRLKAGQRMPSRALLGRIIKAYGLDPLTTLRVYTAGTPAEFGEHLRVSIFEGDLTDDESDRTHRRTAV